MLKSTIYRIAWQLALAMEEISQEAQKLEADHVTKTASDERRRLANVVGSLEEAITELTYEE